ncbi:MAG: TerB family tellurite resistance protein [Candidatus Eisenbacteria bacterium]
MSILKFLGLDRLGGAGGGGNTSAPETVRKIVDALDRMEPERAHYIASFAYILSRVAHADHEISADEVRAMERIVRELGGLQEEESILVVQMAKTQTLLFGSTENYLVTREFYKMATHEQKLQLLESLFAVSSADENISSAEDSEIRRIATEMNLTRSDFNQARAAYTRFLEVLKNAPQPPSVS